MGMNDMQQQAPEIRAVVVEIGPGGGAAADTRSSGMRVLTWSGPDGWRSSSPRLAPRRTRAGRDGDAGFTMIELLVALLVMGILLAIAVPTFLGTSNAAEDRSAQANLATALTDATAQFQNNGQTFFVNGVQDPAGLATLLTQAQLSLTFQAGKPPPGVDLGNSDSQSNVSVAVSGDGSGLVLAAYSVPGDCYYIVTNERALSGSAASSAPYTGRYSVSQLSTSPRVAGTIALPSAPGTSYVTVKGDMTKTDCNAVAPRTNGAPTSMQYLTAGFPN